MYFVNWAVDGSSAVNPHRHACTGVVVFCFFFFFFFFSKHIIMLLVSLWPSDK